MRIQKLLRIFERVDPFWLIFLDKDLCGQISAGGFLYDSNKGAVANRLRRRTSDQTVLGSNPAVAAALSPWTRLFTPIVPRRSLHISFY